MPKVAVVTDSTAYIPADLVASRGIAVVGGAAVDPVESRVPGCGGPGRAAAPAEAARTASIA